MTAIITNVSEKVNTNALLVFTDVNTIAERLKHAREMKGWSQAHLAVLAEVSQGTVGNIESGARQSKGSLPQIAEALGVNHKWLATGTGTMLPTESDTQPERLAIDMANNPDYPAVRRVQFKLSAGATGFGVDYLGEADDAPIVFKRAWFTGNGYRPESLFAVRVANGSMEPGLHDGDTVVVNTAQTTPKDGKVFAVNYEGELVIKRLVRDAGEWWLSSDNPDQRRYPRKLAHAGTLLLGEIVHKQSERI